MPGLSRFDFYPRDWHLDTRDLSNAAKGVYIDLLSSMYARGGPLPYEERELCRLCGCATVRSLRPLLDELLAKGKLRVVDGHLVNGRTMEEIAKAERRQVVASEGGNAKAEAVRAEYELNSSRTQAETSPDIEENQQGSSCSPSPSPSLEEYPPTEGADAPVFLDPKKPFYDLVREVLGTSAGGQGTKLLHHCGGDVSAAMRTLRMAQAKSSPSQYVGGILRSQGHAESTDWDAFYSKLVVSL
jgi:uncharacterized protein YdaU (DUF1376 family)